VQTLEEAIEEAMDQVGEGDVFDFGGME